MSHPAYHDLAQRILDRATIAGKDILRVGSSDLDSTFRLIAKTHNAARYVGIDVELDPNAGKPCRVEELLGHLGPESFDLLICSEVLQHVEDWRRVINLFKRIIRPLGCILITTRSLALPRQNSPRDFIGPPPVESTPGCCNAGTPRIFREHELAHSLLGGLTGLEIGAAAHNPFGLRTRNVALPDGHEFYAAHQRQEMGVEPARVDIWASADRIPVPDASEDFIISSHVLEHLPNVVAAFVEWDRIVRDGGYVFMIVPLKGAFPADEPRELTSLAHFLEDCWLGLTLDTHPLIGVPGGRSGHYHTFTPDSLLQAVEWMRRNELCEWELVAREDIDQKVGNGFTLVFRVRRTRPRVDIAGPNGRYELSDMKAIFSDFEIVTLEVDPSGPGVFLLAKKPIGFQERGLEGSPVFSVTANQEVSALKETPSDSPGGQANSGQDLYDKDYYDSYKSASGVPYCRMEPWLSFFASIAEKIVHEMNPKTVLDAGCAKGFLVEALRDRGVEAFGLDISEYAISQCRDDIKPYCWVASAVDPFPLRYDLIVCIEVLEHLPGSHAESAVANLCAHADDVLFSSAPDDFTESTHVNVQPVEYWAALFAKHGFYRDVEFDSSFIAEHAARFRRVTGPIHSVVRAYERKLWTQLREERALRQLSIDLTREKDQREGQLTEAVRERQRLETQLSAAAQEAQRLQAELTAGVRERQRLETQLSAAAQEAQRRIGEIQERDGTIEELQITMEEKDSRIDGLTADLEEIQSGLGWTLLWKFGKARERVLPAGSRRRATFDSVIRAVRTWVKVGNPIVGGELAATFPRDERPASMPAPTVTSWGSRVLAVNGSHGDMTRYRCYHAQEQLQLCGLTCDVVDLTDPALPALILGYDLVILHRVPHSQLVETIVQTAHRHGISVLFDIDDLVFDPEVATSIDAFRSMGADEQAVSMAGVRGYRRTLSICDAALVTTHALARAVESTGTPAWVHRNALSLELIKISEEAVRTRARAADKVLIGYASGTRTHNRDFREIAGALERVLRAHPQVELWVIGHLDLDERWAKWGNRVKRAPLVPWRALPEALAQLDINLAPLEAHNPFCKAKSELKYIEAAAVGVPTVASGIEAFEYAIRHGDNGLVVRGEDEWCEALERLITDPALRLTMGERARADALQRYHPSTRGSELLAALDEIHRKLRKPASASRSRATGQRRASRKPKISRQHWLAHSLLDGLSGLEIGAAAHNPFGLRTRNVALPEGHEVYADYQRREMGVEPAPVDIWASADRIPAPETSEDYIISSHVVQHLPNVIAAFMEWDRIVRGGGYVFMIVPLKGALPADEPRELTNLAHFVEDYHQGITLTTHSTAGVPGGRGGHYHTFTPDSVLEVVEWMRLNRLCEWELVAREDRDSKVGNGFTLVFRVRHKQSRADRVRPS